MMTQLDVLDYIELNAIRIVDVAVGVGCGHDLRTESLSLLRGEDGHIARSGNGYGLAFEGIILQHSQGLCGVVAQTVSGGLGACQRPAELETLAREYAGVFVADTLVLAEQVADLTAADVDIACRNISELADMAA